MFDPLMLFLFLLHMGLLGGCFIYLSHRQNMPRQDWPFIVLLLFWTTLVFTGHGAGIGKNLGNLTVYACISIVSAGLVAALFNAIAKRPSALPLLSTPALSFAPIENPKMRKFLFWFLAGTLVVFALASVALGLSVYPNNADSMIYRLPRAIWYASHGSFLHPFESDDKRLIFYPFNGIALYIPLVLYGLPGTFHSLPSLISWALIVYTAYRFARELGADRLLSLFAAWLVGVTPSILAQATSTNDEIIAAAAIITCLFMGWRWLVTGRAVYFHMAGLAVALSASTKLHIVFLMPMLGALLCLVAWQIRKTPKVALGWLRAIGLRTGIETLLIVAIIFLPFLFYNYASTGRYYFLDDFKKDVFNLTASLRVGFQNMLIYFSQMFLSPIADLNFWPIANDRQHFNTSLNNLFNPIIKPLLDENPSYYHLGYRFVGITLPVSVRFVEFSLWSAFIWLLWPWQAALAWKQKLFPMRHLFAILALTPILWLIMWCFVTLYMEGTATYFTFYLVIAAPASVMALSLIRRPLLNELRWVCVAIVVITNTIISHNLVMYSGFRALPDIIYGRTWPFDWLLTEKRTINEIRGANRIRIAFTHEKMPYFGYMHWNPSATYYSPYIIKNFTDIPQYEDILQVLPISSLNMYGFMPINIPGKLTPGVTYTGTVRGIGREAIFMAGHGVEKRWPKESNYIVPRAVIDVDPKGGWTIVYGADIAGYNPDDHLTFEHWLKQDDKVIFHREDSKDPAFKIHMDTNPNAAHLSQTTTVRSGWSGKELVTVTYPLGGMGGWLPEGGDY